MHRLRALDLQMFWQRTCKGSVVICWFLGLLTGIGAAAGADSFSFLKMLGDGFTLSISGLLLVVALPFLITALAVYLSNHFLLLAVVFLKAGSFGYLACGILSVFGSAFWLVQFLLMFGDICSMPFLMWVWLRCAALPEQFPKREILCGLAASLVFGILDIWLVSPYLALLI